MNTSDRGRPLDEPGEPFLPPSGGASTFSVLTSSGPAAIAAIQVCGPAVPGFSANHLRFVSGRDLFGLSPCRVGRAQLCEGPGSVLDDALVVVHAGAPRWELRLFLHASPWILRRCGELLSAAGFSQLQQPASPLWPARDAIEAEAHALLPQMQTLLGARWLLGQAKRLRDAINGLLRTESWEDGRAKCLELANHLHVFDWFARPARVALVGPPNAGKSTLANALAEQEVSLSSPQPGTTRDWVEVATVVRGFPIVWLDTAGLQPGGDELEQAGVEKTRECIRGADAVVLVLDGTVGVVPDVREWTPVAPVAVALNKLDHADFSASMHDTLPSGWHEKAVAISAAGRRNLAWLEERVLLGLGRSEEYAEMPGAFTRRQSNGLKVASASRDATYYRTVLRACLSGS